MNIKIRADVSEEELIEMLEHLISSDYWGIKSRVEFMLELIKRLGKKIKQDHCL